MGNAGYEFTTLPHAISVRRYPTHDPLLAHFSAAISRNQPETVISIPMSNDSVEEDGNPDPPTIEFESTNTQNQPEMEITITETPNVEDEQHTAGLHDYSDLKNGAYLLHLYLAFLGLVCLKLIREKHTLFPTTNPFVIISVVAFVMAFTTLSILSWVYEPLQNSNSLSSRYRILKDVYYVLCVLAIISLLPVLFTSATHSHPHHH